MLKRLFYASIFLFLWSFFTVCSVQKPTSIDGTAVINIVAIDTTGLIRTEPASGNARVADARVRLFCTEYDRVLDFRTNDQGEAMMSDLLFSHYRMTVEKFMPAGCLINLSPINKDVMLQGYLNIDIYDQGITRVDTIKLGLNLLSKIVINEIYYSGVPAKLYYDDQFVELYNASDSIQYLDRLIIGRAANSSNHIGPNIVVTSAYQFPGNGNEYPIEPSEFCVIAKIAMDHTTVMDSSIDLSHADWEFFNQLATSNNDPDNPLVKNLSNINPNQRSDFFLNLYHNALFLLKVADINTIPFNDDGFMLFNFSDVLDGIEYSGTIKAMKQIDQRIDAGFAGRGIEKYSGKSTEREHPETGAAGYDTNNSTFDFVTLIHPTPRYQHKPY